MRISAWSSDVCSSDLLTFQQDVEVVGAGDVARAAGTGAAAIERLLHRGDGRRMLAHAEVVVGAPARDLGNAAAVVAAGMGIVARPADRKDVVSGRSVSVRCDLGVCRILKKNKN